MITAKIAREKAQLLGKIEQEIIAAAESGYFNTTTKDLYSDNEFKAISTVLTQVGFLCKKVERKDKCIVDIAYDGSVAIYHIFISWEKEQVIPR